MKKLFSLIALALLIPAVSFAEPADSTATVSRKSPVEAGIGVDLVSSYLWRGSQLDRAAIQPDAYISWKGLTLDVWGSAGIVGESASREIDLSLSYEIKGFSIIFTDYFCPAADTDLFFENGAHTLEVGVGYDLLGYVQFNWYTNVYNDSDYSSYFEVSAPFSIGAVDFSAAVGMSPYRSAAYGTTGFNVVNCSLAARHDFEFSKVTVPLSAQLMFNPVLKQAFFCAGVGISF